jgi:histidyl-tRNA synthetase
LLPAETAAWQKLEAVARGIFCTSGYHEIRLPVFEHTELFKRGVGETTDIVNKEMYTFEDKSGRSLTLRPEGTAGVVRAFLNGGMSRQSPPVKLWYAGPMFRYESIKAGRQRQFNQIGAEAFGSAGPLIDAEVIAVAHSILARAGISGIELQVNSIGCQICRPRYREALREHLAPSLAELCSDCQERFERNPLRMLDCKVQSCQAHYKNVPVTVDYLCAECSEHWQELLSLLEGMALAPSVNSRLVRGLDYYTKTVFEFVAGDPKLGASTTICAGGRYDNLVELFGGPATPAVGWAFGVERVLMLLSQPGPHKPLAFIVSANQKEALLLACDLRAQEIACDLDFPGRGSARSFSKQLQQANRAGARATVILGDDELAGGYVTVKDMTAGLQEKVERQDLAAWLKRLADKDA